MAQYFQISYDQLKQLLPDLSPTVGEENVQYTLVNHGQEVHLNNIQLGNLQVQDELRQGGVSNNCITVVKAENLNGQYAVSLKDNPNNLFVLEHVNSSSNLTPVMQNNESNKLQAISTNSLSSEEALQAIYISTSASQPVASTVPYLSVRPNEVSELSESCEKAKEPILKPSCSPVNCNEGEHSSSLSPKLLTLNKENSLNADNDDLAASEEASHSSVLSSEQVIHNKSSCVASQAEIKWPSSQLITFSLPQQMSTTPHCSSVRQIKSNCQLSTTQVSLPNGQKISLQEYRQMHPQTIVPSSPRMGSGDVQPSRVSPSKSGKKTPRRGGGGTPRGIRRAPSSSRVILLDPRRDGADQNLLLVRNESLQGNVDHKQDQLIAHQGANTEVHLNQYGGQLVEQRQVVMLVPGAVMGEQQMLTVTVPSNEAKSCMSVITTPESSSRQRAATPKNKFISSPPGSLVLNQRSIAVECSMDQSSPGSFVGTPILSKQNMEKFYKGIREGGGMAGDGSPLKAERTIRQRKPRKQLEEPVILTISSDEDEDMEQGKNDGISKEGSVNTYETENSGVLPFNSAVESMLPTYSSMSAFEKEPVIKDNECNEPEEEQNVAQAIEEGLQEPHNGVSGDDCQDKERAVYLTCRTVRIGSYKAIPKDRVVICKQGIRIRVPDVEDSSKLVSITFPLKDVIKALIHFGRAMPVIFLYTTYTCGIKIRKALRMSSKNGYYYDPCASDETQKRITLLPERMTEETRSRLKSIFGSKDLLGELDNKEANDILVRASPKEVQETIKKSMAASPTAIGLRPAKDYSQKILIYPPPPAKGGITINPEDYICLGEEQFLNDVIIDFYLKYLTQSCLSEEDQARTHVFSSFFYKRLTTRPVRSARRHHPMELDSSTSPAEKRHARVKSWTKNVDIFEKDFIVIPINESAHWFLAIICFPGLQGCIRIRDGAPVKLPPRQPRAKKAKVEKEEKAEGAGKEEIQQACLVKAIQIGSTTITPITSSPGGSGNVIMPVATINLDERECALGAEEFSDRDEAEGEEEEDIQMPSESEEEAEEEGNKQVEDDKEKEKPVSQETEIPPEEKNEEKSSPDDNTLNKSEIEFCSPGDPIKQPCILIFDSLGGPSRSRVVATLRDYLRIEYKVKKGEEREFSKDTIRGATPRVPQQTNFVDCGLYVLQYVESFFENPIKDYRIPISSLTQWFPEEVVNGKREAIHELIVKLMKEQNVTVKLPRITLPSPMCKMGHEEGKEEEGTRVIQAVRGEICKNLDEQGHLVVKTDGSGKRMVTNSGMKVRLCKTGEPMFVVETPSEQIRLTQLYDELPEEGEGRRVEEEEEDEDLPFEERLRLEDEEEEMEEGELEDGAMDTGAYKNGEELEVPMRQKNELNRAYSLLITKRKPIHQSELADDSISKGEPESSCKRLKS